MKKILSAVLSMSMIACLTACSTSAPTSTTAAAETTKSEAVESAAPAAAAGETYKIGVIYPLSGGNALFGNDMLEATKIAIEDINNAGGVNGVKIEAVYGDGETAQDASTAATKLIDNDGVNVIIGSMSTGNANAIRSVTERSNTVLFEHSAVGDSVLDGNSGLTFRVCDQGSYRGMNAVDFLCDELAEKLGKQPSEIKIAVINEDSSYGSAIGQGAIDQAKERGVEVAYHEEYDASTTDVTSTVVAIKEAKVDAIIAVSYVSDAILYVDTLTQYDAWPDVFIGCGSGWNSQDVKNTVGAEQMENIFAVDMPSNIQPEMLSTENAALLESFHERLTAATKREVSLSADMAYFGTYVFLNDILPRAASFSTEDIIKAIKETDIKETTVLYGVKFDESGQNTEAQSVVMQWQDGKVVTVWPSGFANGEWKGIPLDK
ncbi:MAG: ABC transporter substrate-binding protein [Eubacteriales bacterium]|nr:ABC transporter substrate-binding protein [Eubacteriales bacterium]